jgi:hypothetical protein
MKNVLENVMPLSTYRLQGFTQVCFWNWVDGGGQEWEVSLALHTLEPRMLFPETEDGLTDSLVAIMPADAIAPLSISNNHRNDACLALLDAVTAEIPKVDRKILRSKGA